MTNQIILIIFVLGLVWLVDDYFNGNAVIYTMIKKLFPS